MPDPNLSQGDLPDIEVEVNKKMKKKRKAELADEMLSPASSRSGSMVARGPPPNPYNNL